MRSSRRTLVVLAAALALAACDRSERGQEPAAEAPQQAPAASVDSTPVSPLPPPATAPANARRSAPPEPTREDSIAAAKEDVSPEWKQRSRQMGGYADCMEQAKAVTGETRARLEEACSRLPSAPR